MQTKRTVYLKQGCYKDDREVWVSVYLYGDQFFDWEYICSNVISMYCSAFRPLFDKSLKPQNNRLDINCFWECQHWGSNS